MGVKKRKKKNTKMLRVSLDFIFFNKIDVIFKITIKFEMNHY
jgi:hypothetical protein